MLFVVKISIEMLKIVFLSLLAVAALGGKIPSNQNGNEEYIVGGKDTDISEIPYQIAMYSFRMFKCGGSIVSPTMVVTAAHCVYGEIANRITLRAGSSNTEYGGVMVKAKKFVFHRYYEPPSLAYDVAVVELETPLKFSNTIQPIKLVTSEPPDDSLVTVSGWGKLKEDGNRSVTLQSVVVPVVNRGTCQEWIKKCNITNTMICAGVEGKDSCRGDSGGPLAFEGRLAGIVSFGIGCGRKNSPGVYTNIADPEITAFIKKVAKI